MDPQRGLSFQTSASEGAILTMPEGAISQDLENIARFRAYAAANVHSWYRYVNGVRGREVMNGDVRLVVGCDKTTSWGMAALFNTNTNQQCQLKFKPVGGQTSDSPTRYIWEYSGMAEVRVGPHQEEIDELRRGDTDDSMNRVKYLNQCLFVRTLNFTLNDDDWEKLNREIGIDCIPDSNIGYRTGTPSRSTYSRDPLSDNTQSTSSTSGNFGIQRSAGESPALEFTSHDDNANRLVFSAPPTATVRRVFKRRAICCNSTLFQSCHPSRILNEALLKMVRHIRM